MWSESDAQKALRAALEAVRTAQERSEAVGYGSEVLGPLHEAMRALEYASAVAEGTV